MDKELVISIINKHKHLSKFAFALVNKFPFNNSLGGGDIGLSLLRKVKIINHGNNNRVVIGDYSRLMGCTVTIRGNNNTVIIGDRCICIQATFCIEDDNNSIEIGNGTALCGKIELAAIEGTSIKIGENCLFSSGIDIRTGDSHSLIQKETKRRINPSKSINIGDHVWIGRGASILKGTAIAEHCMVGAMSLLCKEYNNSNCVVAGVPAREVKQDIDWLAERI